MIGGPISEAAGRRAVYIYTLPIHFLFAAGSGLSQNIPAFLITRFFAAAFGAPALAVSAGTVADVWDMNAGGGPAAVLVMQTFFLGPTLGPLVGGYVMQTRNDWRWLMWVMIIIGAPLWLMALFSKETSKKEIIKKRAKQRGLPGPPKLPPKEALGMLFNIVLLRPIKMLFTDPIVSSVSLYTAFVFGVVFIFFESYPYVFMRIYGFSIGEVGLAFLGILVGIICLNLLKCCNVMKLYRLIYLSCPKLVFSQIIFPISFRATIHVNGLVYIEFYCAGKWTRLSSLQTVQLTNFQKNENIMNFSQNFTI